MVQGVVIEKGCIVDLNPASGAVIGRVPVSTIAELDAAVAAARKVQPRWAAVSLAERTELMKQACKTIGVDKAGLAALITKEMGKILAEAEEEVDDNSNKDDYCDLVRAANEAEIHGGSVIIRHPHGVVSICSPWNFPVEEIVLLTIPALIAGNSVVIKPSEVVPLSSGLVVKCLVDAFEPVFPGLVNLVQGDGTIGAALINHPGVDMCAMTGSTATGAKILQAASATLKPVVLECGGKDPMMVFQDADLDAAAKDAVDFSLMNCGQVCCAVERIYVAEEVAVEFERKVLAYARTFDSGDGLIPSDGPKIGPMVSEMQRKIVHDHVVGAKQAGARCLLGGSLPPKASSGFFYPPTVLAGVPHTAKITREETFGPVVALSTFAGDEESAVRLANDSTYGLTAAVYSADVERAGRVAGRIAAGQVAINSNCLSGHRDIRCPFVGHKTSGYGTHSGLDGWRQFSTPKSLLYVGPAPLKDLPVPAPPAPPSDAPRMLTIVLVSAVCGAAVAMLAARAARK